MWTVILLRCSIDLCPKKSTTFLYPCQTPGQQVGRLMAEHSSAALCIPLAGVLLLGCSSQGDAYRISLHPWEFARSVFLTNYHEQLNLSLRLGSVSISVPADSNLLDWVFNAWQRPLWQCATENGGEEKAAVTLGLPSQAELTWISLAANIFLQPTYLKWEISLTCMSWKKKIKIHNYHFLSILYCRCTYNYLYFKQEIPFMERRNFYH